LSTLIEKATRHSIGWEFVPLKIGEEETN